MNTNLIRTIFLTFGLVALLSGCQEEIDLKLDQENYSKLVVEAFLNDHDDTQRVVLKYTAPYDSHEPCPPVTGAEVWVTDGNHTIYFPEFTPGIYEAHGWHGTPGRTYTLHIVCSGKHYQATSTMPRGFHIDSVGVTPFLHGLPANLPHYQLLVYGAEDPEPNQFYIFQYQKEGRWNDTLMSWSFLSDFAMNGKYLEGAPISIIESYKEQFEVKVRALSVEKEYLLYIDQCIYNYMPNMFFSPPPATVKGNISNGALGYFVATAVSVSEPLVIRKEDHWLK